MNEEIRHSIPTIEVGNQPHKVTDIRFYSYFKYFKTSTLVAWYARDKTTNKVRINKIINPTTKGITEIAILNAKFSSHKLSK